MVANSGRVGVKSSDDEDFSYLEKMFKKLKFVP